MSSLGDFHSGCVLFDVFTTVDTQGRPSALGGNPKPFLVAFKDAFAESQCTAIGFVLALDCNGRTGVNAWSLNTNASPTFYACDHQYQVLLQGGCVDSLCVSGYVVGRFSLNKTSSLKPLIHGRNRVAVTAANEVLADPCSAIFSTRKLLDPGVMTIAPCSTVYAVETLSNTAVAKILDTAITEPTAIFAWASATLRNIIGWLGAVASNRILQEAGQQGVCDRAGTVTIAKATTTDDATTATRSSFT